MKKRIIAWAVLLSVCAAALGLWCSAAAGKTARTLPCKEEGLILSITTFDGKSESKPFLKCFRHTWIGLDNRTGHTVYLKDRAIPDGEMVTFSVWAVSGLSGLLFDFQGYYMMAAMHVGICLLLGVLVWLFLKGTKKLRKKTAVLCVIGVKGHTKARKGGNDHETGM